MNQTVLSIAAVVVAFFVGAIPFGVLVSRAFYKTDIRKAGSGNIGAANALRTLGKRGAIAVLVLDALKGFAPTLAAGLLGGPGPATLAAVASMVGHCWSPFLGGKGGKGVATFFGARLRAVVAGRARVHAGLDRRHDRVRLRIARIDARDGLDGLRAVVRPGQGGPRLRHRRGAVRDLSPSRESGAPPERDGKPPQSAEGGPTPMISSNDFRNGVTIVIEGQLWTVIEFLHVKPGKGSAFVRTRLKNVKSGATVERTFRAGEKLERATVDNRDMQMLYNDGDGYHFMDSETYENFTLQKDVIGDPADFLKDGMRIAVQFHDGTPIGADLPAHVELKVEETDPGFKGDTATGATKPAKLETGATVNVPLFVNPGDVIRIDTRDRRYIGRVQS